MILIDHLGTFGKLAQSAYPWMPTIDKASAEMIMMTNSLLLIFIFLNRFIWCSPINLFTLHIGFQNGFVNQFMAGILREGDIF